MDIPQFPSDSLIDRLNLPQHEVVTFLARGGALEKELAVPLNHIIHGLEESYAPSVVSGAVKDLVKKDYVGVTLNCSRDFSGMHGNTKFYYLSSNGMEYFQMNNGPEGSY